MLCSRFQNNIFWNDFQKRLQYDQEDIPKAIENFKEMIQDCIQDYSVNQDASRALFLLDRLDQKLQFLFDNLEKFKLDDGDFELLVQLYKLINEDQNLQAIASESHINGTNTGSPEKELVTKTPFASNKDSLGYTQASLVGFSTVCTETEQVRMTENGSDKKTLKNGLRLEDRESTGNGSPTQAGKRISSNGSLEIEEGNRVEILKLTRRRLERYLTQDGRSLDFKHDSLEEITPAIDESQREIKERFFDLFGKMRQDFDERKIEDAYEGKNIVMKYIKDHSENLELKEWFDIYLQANGGFLLEIDFWYEEIQIRTQQLEEEKGYHYYEKQKTYNLKYKIIPEGKTIIKMESTLDVSLFNILSLMYEVNGFDKWVPYCKEAKIIKPLYRASFAYWLRYGLPAPLTDRECCCLGIGIDRLERNGSVLIISKSIDKDHEILKKYNIKVPNNPKCIKIDINVATEIVPISDNKVKVKVLTAFDAHVKYVSNGILRWISKKIAKKMFKKLLAKAKSVKARKSEPVVLKNTQENKDFYEWLEQKLKKLRIQQI